MSVMTEMHPTPAHVLTTGTGPTIVFLPGYASDMTGTKAVAIEAWARRTGRAFCRFDYAGCGESPGAFETQTLAGWRDDVITIIDRVVDGPIILVGSSMGGWLMLLATLLRPDRVKGLVGIAVAPDFTDWGFSTEEKLQLLSDGRIERRSAYAEEPTVYSRSFWSSGEANRLMHAGIAINVPVRLIHGQADPDVPYMLSVRLAELLRSADVQTQLIKDGDHRLSRDADIAVIIRAIEEVIMCQ